MAVVISPESELGRELAKWEQPNYRHQAFPKMVYRAAVKANGKVLCCDPEDEAFSARCQRTVQTPEELARAEREGWRQQPGLALEAYHAEQAAIADEAARVAYHAQGMGERARAELAQADEATHEHVVDVVGPKRGRPRGVTGAD